MMSFLVVWRGGAVRAAAAGVALLGAGAGACFGQGAFGGYGQSYRTISMPAHAGEGGGGGGGGGTTQIAGDALPDGRLLIVNGLSILRETALQSGVFETVAMLDSTAMGGGTDAAFLRVSPDGQRIAVGGGFGRPVAVFPAGALPASGLPTLLSPGLASYFNVPHYDAAWADGAGGGGSSLAITAPGAGGFGSPSQVLLLDTLSSPGAPVSRVIVHNIGGASAGIAFDAAGRLYTGNGYDLGPGGGASGTGTLRAFDRSITIDAAVPADFETAGWHIGDILSAGGLAFDAEGNLAVGGGNFDAGEFGYLALVSHTAVLAALSGGGAVDILDPAQVRRLAPDPDAFAFYGGAFNPVTGELYARVSSFASNTTTWYATVPGPGGAVVLGLGLGVLGGRRRRHG